jgi:hypothetical protein
MYIPLWVIFFGDRDLGSLRLQQLLPFRGVASRASCASRSRRDGRPVRAIKLQNEV